MQFHSRIQELVQRAKDHVRDANVAKTRAHDMSNILRIIKNALDAKDAHFNAHAQMGNINTQKTNIANATNRETANAASQLIQGYANEVARQYGLFQAAAFAATTYLADIANTSLYKENANKHKRRIYDLTAEMNAFEQDAKSADNQAKQDASGKPVQQFPSGATNSTVVWLKSDEISQANSSPLTHWQNKKVILEPVMVNCKGGNNGQPQFHNEIVSNRIHKYVKLSSNSYIDFTNLTIGETFAFVICCRLNTNQFQPIFEAYTVHEKDNKYNQLSLYHDGQTLTTENRIEDNVNLYAARATTQRNDKWHVFGMFYERQKIFLYYDHQNTIQEATTIPLNPRLGVFNIDKGKMGAVHVGRDANRTNTRFANMDIKEIVILSGSGSAEAKSVATYMVENYVV